MKSMHLRLSLQFFPHFFLKGVGTVISGTCLKGTIRLNDVLLLGPDSLGQFAPVSIKGIHRKRMPVREVRGGQTCSFALKKARMFEGVFFFTTLPGKLDKQFLAFTVYCLD